LGETLSLFGPADDIFLKEPRREQTTCGKSKENFEYNSSACKINQNEREVVNKYLSEKGLVDDFKSFNLSTKQFKGLIYFLILNYYYLFNQNPCATASDPVQLTQQLQVHGQKSVALL
jgi:hypothetical protein